MTYNVFGGTLNLNPSAIIHQHLSPAFHGLEIAVH